MATPIQQNKKVKSVNTKMIKLPERYFILECSLIIENVAGSDWLSSHRDNLLKPFAIVISFGCPGVFVAVSFLRINLFDTCHGI